MLTLLALPAWAGSIQVYAGGFVSLAVGREHAVGYGFDVGVPYLIGDENFPVVAASVGPFGRFGWGDARGVVAGVRAGAAWVSFDYGWVHNSFATTEVEFGVHTHRQRSVSTHIGAIATIGWPYGGPYTHGRVSWEIARGEPSRASVDFGIGVQSIPFYAFGSMSAGRPLRAGATVVLPRAIASRRASPSEVNAARTELASVPTFLQLAAELRHLGAPGSLIGRAMIAARDEVRHAEDCIALAGAPVVLGSVPIPRPKFQARGEWLALLETEAEVDGVQGEGRAAEHLEARASASRNNVEARTLARMAQEERTHAALAADIAMWSRSER